MTEAAVDVLQDMRRTLRLLVVATVVLFVGLGGGMAWTYSQANESQNALCALRGDLEKRVAGTQTYLAEHPEGFPGVSPATLRKSLKDQQRTIAALGDLPCS